MRTASATSAPIDIARGGCLRPSPGASSTASAASANALAITTWAAAKSNPDDKQLTAQAGKELVAGLTAKESFMRQAAARGLFELNAPAEVVRPLLGNMLKHGDPEVVAEVVDALASLGPKVVPQAVEALTNSDVPQVAARVLARIGPDAKDAVPALAEALGSDDMALRQEAAIALARIGAAAAPATPALTKAIASEDRQASLAADVESRPVVVIAFALVIPVVDSHGGRRGFSGGACSAQIILKMQTA